MSFVYPGDEKDDFSFIFGLIEEHYTAYEVVPKYAADINAVGKVEGVVVMLKTDYYPTFLDKATYLLIQINQGHFFENGNKRLALVMFLYFTLTNSYRFKKYSKDEQKEKLKELFPEYGQFVDFDRFDATDFANYNLSIIIADSKQYGISFDDLKRRVKEFIDFSVEFEKS